MAAARSSEKKEQTWVAWMLRAEVRSFFVSVLALALLGTGAYLMWTKFGDQILAHQSYRLNPEQIEYTPQPDWVQLNLREEVVKLGGFERLDLHQPDLTLRVADAFGLHPWVRKVKRVSKHYPAKIRVEIEYRRPVAMVVVLTGLQPIDAEGVWLLPEGFTPEHAQTYPRIFVGDTSPSGPPGSPWGDPSIVGAAQLAATLSEFWADLKLYQIELSDNPAQTISAADFDLVDRDGSFRVHWGRAPGQELAGEPSPATSWPICARP